MGCLLSTGHLITSCLQESVNSRWFYAYLMGVAAQVKRSYQGSSQETENIAR